MFNMEKLKTIAERTIALRTHYGLNQNEFANRAGLSHVAVMNIENGKVKKPQRETLYSIINTYKTTLEWLSNGTGEMLPEGLATLAPVNNELKNIWKEEAYSEVKSKNALLEKEVDRLWQMIQHLTGGAKPNFLKASGNAYVRKMFPGLEQLTNVSGANRAYTA